MFILNARLILAFLFLLLGILFNIQYGIGSAWYLYIASIILLATHFLFGTVWAAFSTLKKGKVNEADNLLNRIKKPEWLLKSHRAYYHFTKGMIAIQHKDTPTAQNHLKQALDLGLRTDNDNALSALHIAHSSFVERDYKQSSAYLQKAKAFNSNDLMIKENLKELENALAREQN